MARHFDSRNAQPPACVDELAEHVPACFDRRMWRLYLDEAWRGSLDDKALRARMERGEPPDFCEDCSEGYRARMQAEGRCHPPAVTKPKVGRPPKTVAEVPDAA